MGVGFDMFGAHEFAEVVEFVCGDGQVAVVGEETVADPAGVEDVLSLLKAEAQVATVGEATIVWNTVSQGKDSPSGSSLRNCATQRDSSRESPPRSKKLLSGASGCESGSPNTFRQTPAARLSNADNSGTAPSTPVGSGVVLGMVDSTTFRSTLPFAVRGSSSRTVTMSGTMYPGSFVAAISRTTDASSSCAPVVVRRMKTCWWPKSSSGCSVVGA